MPLHSSYRGRDKGKHRAAFPTDTATRHSDSHGPTHANARPKYPPSAYIQAYEADVIFDEPQLARSVAARSEGSRRGGLIPWEGEGVEAVGEGASREIWTDRYDVLHLLPSLPPSLNTGSTRMGTVSSSHHRETSPAPSEESSTTSSAASSSTDSWGSLSSDVEETFYLSSEEEIQAYEREKKTRWMVKLREERLKEREREDEVLLRTDAEKDKGKGRGKGWGGDDEVPPEAISTLMSHTALSLSKSPNPSLLELRILTHHSTDDRFAFLRSPGRWKDTWERIKRQIGEKERKERREKDRGGEEEKMGVLMGGYESSDDDDEEEDAGGDRNGGGDGHGDEGDRMEPLDSPPPPPATPPSPPEDWSLEPPPPPPPPSTSPDGLRDDPVRERGNVSAEAEEAKRQERRRRAEEWKKNRARS